MEILEQLEAENSVGVLLLGRPYHLDPGLNHGVLEEFQALGYPILSIRSIPKDPEWLDAVLRGRSRARLHRDAARRQDVWPENYSANSVQKVWAAKFAARHPNVVVLDLSSFKCGHDAPTYGLIDNIIDVERHAVLGAARHRRQQAGRLDQDPRQDLRAHAEAATRSELEDRAAKRDELQRRVDEKRRELLRSSPRRSCATRRSPIRARARSSKSSKRHVCAYAEEDACRPDSPRRPRGATSRRRHREHAMVFHRKAPERRFGDTSHEDDPTTLDFDDDRSGAASVRGRGARAARPRGRAGRALARRRTRRVHARRSARTPRSCSAA